MYSGKLQTFAVPSFKWQVSSNFRYILFIIVIPSVNWRWHRSCRNMSFFKFKSLVLFIKIKVSVKGTNNNNNDSDNDNNTNNGNNTCNAHFIMTRWSTARIKLEFGVLVFGRKTGKPGEKNPELGREPTTNSTHMWRRVRESNQGHNVGRQVLSPLRHPSTPP